MSFPSIKAIPEKCFLPRTSEPSPSPVSETSLSSAAAEGEVAAGCVPDAGAAVESAQLTTVAPLSCGALMSPTALQVLKQYINWAAASDLESLLKTFLECRQSMIAQYELIAFRFNRNIMICL